MLRTETPATGKNDAELVTWWNANKDNVVFDPQAKKFVLKPAIAAPPAPAPAPSPAPVPVPPAPATH